MRRKPLPGHALEPDLTHDGAASATTKNAHPRLKRLRLVAAITFTVVVFLACSSPQVVQLTKAPADQLRLQVRFTNALVSSRQVIIDVTVLDKSSNHVDFSDHQHLTVNGQEPDSGGGVYRFRIPRPPDGGSYTIVYTDEQGQRTSVVVPAPQRAFAITSPAKNARLPIPQSSASTPASFTVQYSVPFDGAALPTIANRIPQRFYADVRGRCKIGGPDGTPVSSPYCTDIGPQGSSPQSSADSITIQDQPDNQPKYKFDNLAPGPGFVEMLAQVDLLLQTTGFASVSVDFTDGASIPVIWV